MIKNNRGFRQYIMASPVMINLELTSTCNVKCRHCYNFWREDNDSKVVKFTREKFDRFIEMAVDAEVFHVVLTGGEPFVSFDILEYALKRLTENGISNSVNSNLMLATPEKIKRLQNVGLDHILTSLNSYDPKTNDHITCKNGSFNMIVRGIETARQEGVRVSVNMILSQLNKHHVYETGRLVNGLGCQRLFATRVVPNVSIDTPAQSEFRLDIEDTKLILEQLVRVNTDFGLSIGTLVSYPLCVLGDLKKFRVLVGRGCPSQRGVRMSVNAEGTSHACVHEEESYGNIFAIGIKGVFANMRNWHDGSYLYEGCLTCDYVEVCGSGCRMVANSYHNRLDGPDNLMTGKDNITGCYEMDTDEKLAELINNKRFIVSEGIRFRREDGFYVLNVRWANAFPVDTDVAEYLIKSQMGNRHFTINDFGVDKKETLIRLLSKNVVEPVDKSQGLNGLDRFEGVSLNPFNIS